jgi:hypothetical protein
MGWREEIYRGLFIGEREYLYDASREDSPRRRNREKQSGDTRSASLID